MLLAIVGNGVAGAMYIGSQLGPGPRDGLMTGLARRTGRSIRLVRTSLEVTVVVLGFALGGIVGVGTVLYALLIGPIVQFFLPMLTVRVERPAPRGAGAAVGTPQPSTASANGRTPAAPARRSARPATVRVQRESTRSSTSSTGPSTPASAAASSGPTTSRSQTPASRNALLPPGSPVGPPCARSSAPR